jgi:hypothetical protein
MSPHLFSSLRLSTPTQSTFVSILNCVYFSEFFMSDCVLIKENQEISKHKTSFKLLSLTIQLRGRRSIQKREKKNTKMIMDATGGCTGILSLGNNNLFSKTFFFSAFIRKTTCNINYINPFSYLLNLFNLFKEFLKH